MAVEWLLVFECFGCFDFYLARRLLRDGLNFCLRLFSNRVLRDWVEKKKALWHGISGAKPGGLWRKKNPPPQGAFWF